MPPRTLQPVLIPTEETQVSTIEAAFQDFTERKDIAILLINQHVRISFDGAWLVSKSVSDRRED